MWNRCLPSEPSSSAPLHFFKSVLRLPAQEMLLCLIPWVVRSSRRSTLLESPSSLHVMLAGFLRARRQDKDGVQLNVHLKCSLDREDCTSLRFPFILPYAWISRRDFCLVGVSCHIPSSGLIYACFHVCIMSIFSKLELRNFGSLKNLNKRGAKTLEISFIAPKCSS